MIIYIEVARTYHIAKKCKLSKEKSQCQRVKHAMGGVLSNAQNAKGLVEPAEVRSLPQANATTAMDPEL
ncbi:MAG: hypothetical protein KGJ59_03605 [Bacteroidota bacterium]|nr:hypothetical protein [Bacteroidota bacterium]